MGYSVQELNQTCSVPTVKEVDEIRLGWNIHHKVTETSCSAN
jgi:hypothetical protein